MTKERRSVRHQLQRVIAKHGLSVRFRAVATTKQIRAAAKQICNVVLSGKDPRTVVHTDGTIGWISGVSLD